MGDYQVDVAVKVISLSFSDFQALEVGAGRNPLLIDVIIPSIVAVVTISVIQIDDLPDNLVNIGVGHINVFRYMRMSILSRNEVHHTKIDSHYSEQWIFKVYIKEFPLCENRLQSHLNCFSRTLWVVKQR